MYTSADLVAGKRETTRGQVGLSQYLVVLASAVAIGLLASQSVAADNEAANQLLNRMKAISDIVVCGDLKRQSESGPRDAEDRQKVEGRAAAGAASCQMLLARWNERGEGYEKDYALAKKWYAAASTTTPAAFAELGRMAELGLGEAPSAAKAVALYREGDAQNDPKSQVGLGFMFERGLGVEQSDAQAAALYRKAASRWDNTAWLRLDALQSEKSVLTQTEMSSDQQLWYRVLAQRFGRQVGTADELEGLKAEKVGTVLLKFDRGSSSPAVTLKSGTGDEIIDRALVDVAARVRMPPPPIFSKEKQSLEVVVPVDFRPDNSLKGEEK